MELLIVVAIISIIAAVSYPSYEQFVVRAKRRAGTSMLLQIADLQQKVREVTVDEASETVSGELKTRTNMGGRYFGFNVFTLNESAPRDSRTVDRMTKASAGMIRLTRRA